MHTICTKYICTYDLFVSFVVLCKSCDFTRQHSGGHIFGQMIIILTHW